MAQPDRLEGAPDAAVGVDGVERQLQPAAVSQRVAASKAAAEKRTAKAMSADERAIKRRADQRLRRAKASDRGEQHGRATAVEGKQHSPAEAEETVESAVEHLGLPPLTAVRPDARASAAVMAVTLLPPLSLPPPPQPPAQRTAAESAAAERAAAEEAKERAAAEIGLDANFRRVKGIFPEIISSLELAYFPEISLEFPWKCIMRWRRRRRQRRRRLRRLANEALLFGNSLPTHIIPS